MRQFCYIIVIAVFSLVNCTSQPQVTKHAHPTPQTDDAIAHVNGIPIYQKDLEAQMTRAKRFNPAKAENPQVLLDELIDNELLFQKARELHLDETPQIKRMMVRSLTRDYIKFDKVVSDDALKKYYDDHAEEFTEIRASHILLKANRHTYTQLKNAKDKPSDLPETFEAYEAKQKEKIMDILKKAQSGANFEELAKTYSEGPSRSKGGDLGYFTKNRMVPEFSEVAFGLKNIGDLSDIVQTKFGYHIIKLTDRRIKPFDKQIVLVRSKVIRERKNKAYKDYIDALRKKATIHVFNDKLKKLNAP